MNRNNRFYKDIELLNYYIYNDGKFSKPQDWYSIDKCNDEKSGMYAEAYKNDSGDVVMVIRGTEIGSVKDWYADVQLKILKIPNQSESAFQFYKDLELQVGNGILPFLKQMGRARISSISSMYTKGKTYIEGIREYRLCEDVGVERYKTQLIEAEAYDI